MRKWGVMLSVITLLFGVTMGVSIAANQELDQQLILFAQGDFETVKQLVAQGADVNARDQNGVTPLMSAASGGQTEIASFLISKGADVNSKNKSGFTPLICAAMSGNQQVVQLLIDKGADVNAKDKEGYTAAYYASMYQYNDLAEMLMATGKSSSGSKGTPAQTQKELDEAVLFAMANKDYNRVMNLIERGASVKVRYPDNEDSLLHAAVDQGSSTMVEYLLGKGLDVNTRQKDGETPLYYALVHKQVALVNLLLNKGAMVDIKNEVDRSPLYFFVTNCHENFSTEDRQIAELLIKRGADVNQKNCFDNSMAGNQTALHSAALSGNLGFVEFLLEKGASINVRDNAGATPLHYGVSSGNPQVVALLIAKGADPNIRDGAGMTPLRWAEEKNDSVMMAMLKKAGAK